MMLWARPAEAQTGWSLLWQNLYHSNDGNNDDDDDDDDDDAALTHMPCRQAAIQQRALIEELPSRT